MCGRLDIKDDEIGLQEYLDVWWWVWLHTLPQPCMKPDEHGTEKEATQSLAFALRQISRHRISPPSWHVRCHSYFPHQSFSSSFLIHIPRRQFMHILSAPSTNSVILAAAQSHIKA
jgi:hypothetical protein